MSDHSTLQPQPGWYPDPHDPQRRRYWDGELWTTATAPLAQAPEPGPQTMAPGTYPAPADSGSDSQPGRVRALTTILLLSVVGTLVLGVGGCAVFFLGGLPVGNVTNQFDEFDVEIEAVPPDRPDFATDDAAAEAADSMGPNTTLPPGFNVETTLKTRAGAPDFPPITEPFTPDAEGPYGSRDQPLPYGEQAQITQVDAETGAEVMWAVTVLPLQDFTNDPNNPLAYGVFDLSIALLEGPGEGVVPPEPTAWAVVGGATGVVQRDDPSDQSDRACGSLFNPYPTLPLSPGETVGGTMCVPIFAEDVSHPDTVVMLDLGPDGRAFFG